MLIGNLTRDPEIKTFENGGKVASFAVATNKEWVDRETQEKKKSTEFHNIVIRNVPMIEKFVEPYVKKGQKVYIEGENHTRSYDKDEKKVYIHEVVAFTVNILSSKGTQGNDTEEHASIPAVSGGEEEGGATATEEATTVAAKPVAKAAPKKEEEINIEDIPF